MSAQTRNPFVLKVGQLMTGFGAGCGIGVGVGYPIALGSIPVLGEMMSATSSAGSRAFGGVGHNALGMLRKLGIKNLKAGVGCGVGVGHGFGVGIALKPGVSEQVLHSLQDRLSAAASQLQKYLPTTQADTGAETLQHASSDDSTSRQSIGGMNAVAEAPQRSTVYGLRDVSSVTKTEPVARGVSTRGTEEVEELRQENEILRTLLRHQELIEDLKVQNASILQILSEQTGEVDLDRNHNSRSLQRVLRKRETRHAFHNHQDPIKKCFDCRISARRRR